MMFNNLELYEKQVKQKRVEVIKKLKYQKEQKEQKKCIELAKITSTVDSHGGLCTSIRLVSLLSLLSIPQYDVQ
jgi:hypothetical protein